MLRVDFYKTRQRDLILATVKKQTKAFTAKDLYADLEGKIGLVTIYRFLERASADGLLLTFSENNTTFYQYSPPCKKTDHFYLKCDHCGRLEHIDCKKIQGLTSHILTKHHFKPLKDHLIINGLCENCH